MSKPATPIMSDNYSPLDLVVFKAAQTKCEQELVSDVIDTIEALTAVLGVIASLMLCGSSEPQLYLMTQGCQGKMSLLSVYILDADDAFHIDVQTLGPAAFNTPNPLGTKTLKNILESSHVTKVFFDVRTDSAALFSQFGVRLSATWDLQLLQVAKGWFPTATKQARTLKTSLLTDVDGGTSTCKYSLCEEKMYAARRLTDPALGGSCDVWEQRPLPRIIVTYSRICVAQMPHMFLWSYDSISPEWQDRCRVESSARIARSETADSEPHEDADTEIPSSWITKHAKPIEQPKPTNHI